MKVTIFPKSIMIKWNPKWNPYQNSHFISHKNRKKIILKFTWNLKVPDSQNSPQQKEWHWKGLPFQISRLYIRGLERVKHTGCSSRGSEFNSHTQIVAHTQYTPVLGCLTPCSGLYRCQTCMRYTDIHASKSPIHIKISKSFF